MVTGTIALVSVQWPSFKIHVDAVLKAALAPSSSLGVLYISLPNDTCIAMKVDFLAFLMEMDDFIHVIKVGNKLL